MRIKRLCLCAILIFSIITIMFIAPAWCSATLSDNGNIQIPIEALKENMSDAEALVAENAELKAARDTERANVKILTDTVNELIANQEAERQNMSEQLAMKDRELEIKDKQLEIMAKQVDLAYRKGLKKGTTNGSIAGFFVGALLVALL